MWYIWRFHCTTHEQIPQADLAAAEPAAQERAQVPPGREAELQPAPLAQAGGVLRAAEAADGGADGKPHRGGGGGRLQAPAQPGHHRPHAQ